MYSSGREGYVDDERCGEARQTDFRVAGDKQQVGRDCGKRRHDNVLYSIPLAEKRPEGDACKKGNERGICGVSDGGQLTKCVPNRFDVPSSPYDPGDQL